jgi:hypothetical protein
VWTLRFEFKSSTRLDRFDLKRARAVRPAAVVPVIAVLLGVYAAYFQPVSINPSVNGVNTTDPAIEVKGSGPPSARFVSILRNGYGWQVPLVNGQFASLVPLLPGLNRIQAAVNGRVSAPVDVTGPSITAANVSSAMAGKCSGVIAVHPASGHEGEPDLVIVNLDSASAKLIARVTTDNPLCHDCDAARTAPNQFTVSQIYHGRGPFRVTFIAMGKDGKVRCQGTSAELTALGPR